MCPTFFPFYLCSGGRSVGFAGSTVRAGVGLRGGLLCCCFSRAGTAVVLRRLEFSCGCGVGLCKGETFWG